MFKWILFTILCGHSILAADDESVVACGRDVMNSSMWRVYLQNSRDVGSTRRVVKTGFLRLGPLTYPMVFKQLLVLSRVFPRLKY